MVIKPLLPLFTSLPLFIFPITPITPTQYSKILRHRAVFLEKYPYLCANQFAPTC